MLFQPENEKITAVILNYNFPNAQTFWENPIRRRVFEACGFEERSIPMNIHGAVTKDVLHHLSMSSPCRAVSPENGFALTFVPQEARLIVEKDPFVKDTDIENLRNILGTEALSGAKISDISAIGLNFSAEFNFGQKTLQLFNDTIFGVDAFSRNLTFELLFPAKYEGYVATYKIREIASTEEDKRYEISVNFHFELMNFGPRDKLYRVDEILGGDYYAEFLKTADDFLGLHA